MRTTFFYSFLLSLMCCASAAWGTTPCTPGTFTFTGSNSSTGTPGNVRSFTANGVSVKVTAFSRTKGSTGTWATAYLGIFDAGLGVTDRSEDGSNNSHTVDNIGRDNYVLFEFSQPVIISQACVGYVVTDSDMSVWIGSFSDPYNSHLNLSDSVLASFGFTQTSPGGSGTRCASVNSGQIVGNALIVAAWPGDTVPNDQFKINKVAFCKPTLPSCSVTGAGSVCAGSSGNKYYAPSGVSTYSWSISGSGSIVGATNQQTVTVTAGGAGSFTIRGTISNSSTSTSCFQVVTVNATPACSISGASSVCPTATGNKYVAPSGMSSYAWSISGCGTIIGVSNQQTLTVNALGCCGGSFTVSLNISKSGCTSNCQKTVTLTDNTPPVITCPADKNLQCGASTSISSNGSATATDNCTHAPTITSNDVPVAASCTGRAGIDRVWTATDGCGNTASCTQHIRFVDTTPPVITCPADKNLQCGASTLSSNTGSATATDNCTGSPTITSNDIPVAANCTGKAGIDRVWTATDGCGNTASCTQHIRFVDTTAPVITCPADKNIQCGDLTNPTSTGAATATDNCNGTPTITFSDSSGTPTCAGIPIVRVWRATDACGNSATCTQRITYVDTTPPVITCPADKNLQCGASTSISSNGSATATDNCSGSTTITSNDIPVAANCTGKAGIDRVWTARDACGNTSTCTQYLRFVDTTPPVITCPSDKNLQCGASTNVSNTGSATATDNCNGTPTITFSDSQGSPTCAGTPIVRVWTAVDGCGNTASCTQNIRFVDTTPPVITCPSDKNLQCGDSTSISSNGSATATDNCSGTPTITSNDIPVAANCTSRTGIDRVWTATDACGNTASCTQHLRFVDTTPPVITCPADKNLQCGDSTSVANNGSATATDNCTGSPTITSNDIPVAANCTGRAGIDRVWTATDGCGNSASCTQRIRFVDTTPPVITCPADKNLQCGASTNPSNTGTATATDNCNGTPTITFSDSQGSPTCAGTPINRVWTATDACGNSASCTQHIAFVDTTPPVITCPADKNLQCGDLTAVANNGSATATDNCSGMPTITSNDIPVAANCTGRAGIDRVWTATDGCGNTASCTQHLRFVDTTPPVITCPADKQIQCNDSTNPSNTGSATATDNCNGTPSITYSDSPGSPTCAGTPIVRVWTATDACGNNATCTQNISYVDTTAPVITCPADKNLQCGDSTAVADNGSATATDNCNGSPTITSNDIPVAANCTGRAGIDRVWTARDACGNTASCTQLLRFVDTTPPVITCPADKNLQCGDSANPSNTGSATATDNCTNTPTITFSDSQGTPTCAGTPITRVWMALDACGNTASCTQNITYVDTTVPVITCPADKNLQCGDSTAVADNGSATATDNCGGTPTITFSDTPTAANCTSRTGIERVWTATDGCGNTASCTQHLRFVDTTPPVITCPADKNLECGDSTNPSNTASATATDNCTNTPTISFNDVPAVANCTGRAGIDRIWTAMDGCGNSASCTQRIRFVDTTAPVITCPADKNLPCGASTSVSDNGSATATDNCSTPNIEHTDIPVAANCTGRAGIDRVWTATDGCGNSASCTQQLRFVDTTPPVITCPADKQIQCGDSTAVADHGSATATDNCNGMPSITFSDSQGTPTCGGGFNRVWTATDGCGNTASCTQHFTYLDTIPPVITCPPDVQLHCGDSTQPCNPNLDNNPQAHNIRDTGCATATDNCGGSVTICYTDMLLQPGCTGRKPIDRVWTAVDACGNIASCTQHITFADTTPPVITCPANATLTSGQTPEPHCTGVATATDNCVGNLCVTFGDTLIPPDSNGFAHINRLWTATDGCGNTASCTQNITYRMARPIVMNCPSDILNVCSDMPISAACPTATSPDCCATAVTVTCVRSDGQPLSASFPVGTTTITAIANDACGNTAMCSYRVQTIACVDLIVQSLTLNKGSYSPGETATATVTIKNQGDASTVSGFDVKLYRNSPTTVTCATLSTAVINPGPLAAGASVTFTMTFVMPTSAGTFTTRVFTDGSCSLTESSESNNQTTISYTVPPLSDVIVQSLTLNKSSYSPGETATATVTIKNQGSVSTASGFDVKLYRNGPSTVTCMTLSSTLVSTGSLAAGASVTFTMTFVTPPGTGAFTARVFADGSCSLTESVEANNQETVNYSVTPGGP